MYFVIESKKQLDQLSKVDKAFIDLISLSEEAHPTLTSPCVLYYNDFQKGYIIPIKHPEGFSVGVKEVQEFLSDIPRLYLVDKKWHSYFFCLPQAIDVYFNILETNTEIKDTQCYTAVHLDFHSKFKYRSEVNSLIPISKHYEKSECMFEAIKEYIGQEKNTEWYSSYVETYRWVEEQGIKVDERVLDRFFEPTWKVRSIRDNTIYTSYNLYNITSRPTNAFNGINFLAFNKENGSRATFIPKNDIFIEFDYDGYHIRLIANLLELQLPVDESIHTILGKQYFKKEKLTPEEYQESKKITFKQLYNGVEFEYRDIEFFNRVDKFTQVLWEKYSKQGSLCLPNERNIKIENPTPQKLLNYYIQCLETVNNVKKLKALRELLKNKKSKVVLVVYDSILVDYSVEDGGGFLKQIKDLLEEGGYKVKAKKGNSYNF